MIKTLALIIGAAIGIAGLCNPSFAGDMLPTGPLSTRGRHIVDKAGDPVRIAAAAYWFANPRDDLPRIAAAGFNTVRVAMVNRRIDDDLRKIDEVVAAAARVGVRVIIDNHTNEGLNSPCWGQQANGMWYDSGPGTDGTDGCGVRGTVTRARWVADWVKVARRYKGNDTVIGYDLRNEPVLRGSGSSGVTWGDGNPLSDLRLAYQEAGDAIQAVDPDKLIICEGPINYGGNLAGVPGVKAPWGDLSTVKQYPVVLTVPQKVVYSVHDYPHETSGFMPDNGPAKVAMMDVTWGYIPAEDIAPVFVGEWAADMHHPTDKAWAETLIGYMNDPAHGPASSSYWMWGIDPSCQSCGIIDGHGRVRPDQRALWDQVLYRPPARPAQSAPCATCADGQKK